MVSISNRHLRSIVVSIFTNQRPPSIQASASSRFQCLLQHHGARSFARPARKLSYKFIRHRHPSTLNEARNFFHLEEISSPPRPTDRPPQHLIQVSLLMFPFCFCPQGTSHAMTLHLRFPSLSLSCHSLFVLLAQMFIFTLSFTYRPIKKFTRFLLRR